MIFLTILWFTVIIPTFFYFLLTIFHSQIYMIHILKLLLTFHYFFLYSILSHLTYHINSYLSLGSSIFIVLIFSSLFSSTLSSIPYSCYSSHYFFLILTNSLSIAYSLFLNKINPKIFHCEIHLSAYFARLSTVVNSCFHFQNIILN